MKLRQLMMVGLLVVVSLTFTGCGGNMAAHDAQGHMNMNMHE
ncbi:hypothetical protein [Tumebacillus amylolyticus]|nr:hypothetical protein [Tumebacillus amylolyticus]